MAGATQPNGTRRWMDIVRTAGALLVMLAAFVGFLRYEIATAVTLHAKDNGHAGLLADHADLKVIVESLRKDFTDFKLELAHGL